MTTSRVPLLDDAKAKIVADAAECPEELTKLAVFRILLHKPEAARALGGMLRALLLTGSLEPRLRELVIMRIAWRERAAYEWTHHWEAAKRSGLSKEDIVAVADWRAHPGYGRAERAVLAATDQWVEHGAISDVVWTECAATLGDDALLVELVAVIGVWTMMASLLKSLRVPLEDGLAAWPPEGRAPDNAES